MEKKNANAAHFRFVLSHWGVLLLHSSVRSVPKLLPASETVDKLRPLLSRLVADSMSRAISGRDLGRDAEPIVYSAPDLYIEFVPWKHGDSTPIHNHNMWVLIAGITGNERNVNYRRLDDGSAPWHARLEENNIVDILSGVCASILPPNDIHAVAIPNSRTTALNIYGTNLSKEWRYQFNIETGEVTPSRK
jgi:predicted metal-dependent enzyme (double-stranded beta helix superfamily)